MKMLTRSQELLLEGWSNPTSVGLGSAFLETCETHLNYIRSHRSPLTSNSEARNIFLGAMRLGWFAVWLARDYSIQGLAKHHPEMDNEINRLTHRVGVVDICGRQWLEPHAPLFDERGAIVREKKNTISAEFRVSTRLLEGTQIGWPAYFDSLTNQTSRFDLKWVYASKDVGDGLPNESRLDCSFLEELGEVHRGSGIRSNSLKFATVVGSADLRDIQSTTSLADARFESDLTIVSNSPLQNVLPRNCSVAGTMTVASTTIQNPKTSIPSDRILRVHFRSVTIQGDLSIVACELPSEVFLVDGTIHGNVSCDGATIDVFKFSGGLNGQATFNECNFQSAPDFSSLSCTKRIDFLNCKLCSNKPGNINFENSKCPAVALRGGVVGCGESSLLRLNHANWITATIENVLFDCHADFRVMPSSEVSLLSCRFNYDFDFRCPSGYAEKRESAAIQQCTFFGEADFRNVVFGNTTEFDNCRFTLPPKFFDATLHSDTSFSGTKFDWKSRITANVLERTVVALVKPLAPAAMRAAVESDELYLRRVERAFTELREHAEEIQARPLAAQFHQEELEARRLRVLDRGVPRSERWANTVYRELSRYGDSFVRPLIWLVATWIFCGLLYWWQAGWYPENFGASSSLSLSTTLKPWATLDPAIVRAASEWDGRCEAVYLLQEGGKQVVQDEFCIAVQLTHFHGPLFRTISVVQSILSLILIFLTLLAVRRKFQLS